MTNRFSLDRLLARTGGRYLIIVIAVAQLIALLGAIPGILSISANAEFNERELQAFSWLVPLSIILSNILLLGLSWLMTASARKRLDDRSQTLLISTPDEEYKAWREITSLTWRYGIVAGLVIMLVNILPVFLITLSQSEVISSPFQPTSINSPAPAYVVLGGLASLLGSVLFAVLMIERLTLPARLVLVPVDFDTQLKGRFGALLIGKFQILILALIAISVLLIAPIGYQQTVRILYSEVSSLDRFSGLQSQSLLFSLLALLIGAAFSYYVSKSVSDPMQELINTFTKIEQGDLTARVPVTATDELGIVNMHFNRMVAQLEALQNTQEQQVAERTKQLTASNEVGRVAASSLDPDELLGRVIRLFPEQFGYYYAAIYLLDSTEKWAELIEASGDAGQVLKKNHHRLEVDGKSMVGTAIRERSPRIAQIASQEKNRFENPLLPYTRSEIALPLIVGDRVLGALNVQSTREADFGPQVIETMQNMTAQVSIALENARLYQAAQKVIKEMRAIQQQYLQEGWSGYSAQHNDLEYAVGDETLENSRHMEVSISLRDQILGQITLAGNDEWTQDQRSLVDAVATQAAIALENARLVSESRQVAIRERMLAEINSKIWSSATIDGVLQTVVKELGRRLNASQVTVELNMEDHS
ncbi:MAG TPA: GAF domain-containing protein [Anaerolineales bacterium]|nr:GAF domain-containing protein [Anaerolineales bacterium]